MTPAYFDKQRTRFQAWWRAPVVLKDRILGSIVAAMGMFWIGVLGGVMACDLPASFSSVAWIGLASSAVGLALGMRFPKIATLVLFPFAITG